MQSIQPTNPPVATSRRSALGATLAAIAARLFPSGATTDTAPPFWVTATPEQWEHARQIYELKAAWIDRRSRVAGSVGA